jgi:hypothetical protein
MPDFAPQIYRQLEIDQTVNLRRDLSATFYRQIESVPENPETYSHSMVAGGFPEMS